MTDMNQLIKEKLQRAGFEVKLFCFVLILLVAVRALKLACLELRQYLESRKPKKGRAVILRQSELNRYKIWRRLLTVRDPSSVFPLIAYGVLEHSCTAVSLALSDSINWSTFVSDFSFLAYDGKNAENRLTSEVLALPA